MQDDVWVKRLNALFDGLSKVVIAAASIIAAWQSVNNASAIQVVKDKQDAQVEAINKLPPMMGAKG